MNILVTGANGFIGKATCAALRQAGHAVTPIVRRPNSLAGEQIIGDIGGQTDWCTTLTGMDGVVHLAARVHLMRDTAADPLAQYRAANVEGTLHLARQAAAAGVRRFVFVSSIKVNGAERAKPYTEADAPQPADDYARSKWEAEQGLWKIATQTRLEVVILRPPLVYGPGVRANFLALLRAVARGMPLPLGAIHNQRSLVYVGNLTDAIIHCLEHPAAVGKTFLVSDGEGVSTPELVRRIAAALGRPARLLPVPSLLLRMLATLTKKSALARRLMDSLTLDNTAIRHTLNWSPPFTLDEGLSKTAAWYLSQKK